MELQKETKAHGRWYDDACGTAFGLELIGERWSLLVVRELMLGGRRFTDLRESLPGISAKVLTERLTALEHHGVLSRRQLPRPSVAQVYELTEWGYRAEPVIQELGRWAAMSSAHDPTLPLSPVSLMLSMRTMFVPAKAIGLSVEVGFVIAGEEFVAAVRNGLLSIVREDVGATPAVIRAQSAPPIAALVYLGPESEEADPANLVVEGDRSAVMRYAGLFELPPPLA